MKAKKREQTIVISRTKATEEGTLLLGGGSIARALSPVLSYSIDAAQDRDFNHQEFDPK